jgi:hypothetical protein
VGSAVRAHPTVEPQRRLFVPAQAFVALKPVVDLLKRMAGEHPAVSSIYLKYPAADRTLPAAPDVAGPAAPTKLHSRFIRRGRCPRPAEPPKEGYS